MEVSLKLPEVSRRTIRVLISLCQFPLGSPAFPLFLFCETTAAQSMIGLWLNSGADWAAWHLPGGPVGPASRWAATSDVEVGQTTYPVNRGRVGKNGREASEEEGQSHKDEGREGESTGERKRGLRGL